MLYLNEKQYKNVTLADLQTMPDPVPLGKMHNPVRHDRVLAEFSDILNEKGYSGNVFVSVRDSVFIRKGTKTKVPNGRMIARYDLEGDWGILPPGVKASMTVINSHDESRSLSIIAGLMVQVCTNGMMIAEGGVSKIGKKHYASLTPEVIRESITASLDSIPEKTNTASCWVRKLQSQPETDESASLRLIECAKTEAVKANQIVQVFDEWRNPRHEDFRDRNSWSLYNTVTEFIKGRQPEIQIDAHRDLNKIFLPEMVEV